MSRSTPRRPVLLAPARLAAPLLGVAIAVVLVAAAAPSRPVPQEAAPSQERPAADGKQPRVLVFSRTKGFRHGSIPTGIKAMHGIGKEHGFRVEATEDPTWFKPDRLATFDGVVFLNTTGDVLDDDQQKAFEAFIRGGGGYVGIHSAADTEYDWPWYGRLVGAYFKTHPRIQPATINVENRTFPATKFLPEKWQRTDEWYVYRENPRPNVKVLLSLDESTFEGGGMNGDHPIAWYQEYDGGRAFYTGGGHTNESFGEPMFRRHLGEAVMWSTGRKPIPGTPSDEQAKDRKTKAGNR